jgi:glycosyltransferase involved in cell wall biosynthesis
MTSLQCAPAAAPEPSELTPLVSVVIPCYNSARYLTETIESVLSQTYPRVDIVVDDGSSDATPEIARSYPVQYIFQRNRGISAARNTGVLQS